jgi:hypothetical protein
MSRTVIPYYYSVFYIYMFPVLDIVIPYYYSVFYIYMFPDNYV